jgi:UDP:flavonoid glycosyltransferase YjiC (YdhE family)
VVLGTGHPTTVLGALRWERPLVLLPNGSGTDEAAAACVVAGVARAHPAEQLSVDVLVDMLSDAISSHRMRSAASRLGLELQARGGLGEAARRIVELVERAKQSVDPRMVVSTA